MNQPIGDDMWNDIYDFCAISIRSSVKKKDGNILELNVKSAEAAANDNYDPYAHRSVEHPTT